MATELIDEEEIEEELLEELSEGEPPESDDNGESLGDGSLEQVALDFVSSLPSTEAAPAEPAPDPPPPEISRLEAEIEELTRYALWARSIGVDTKARALLTALQVGFDRMMEMGAAQKAVVFTESRRTQQYLKAFLEANGYAGRTITFNGTNSEPEATVIYQRWVEANRDTGRASGSRVVDIRTALIEHFRDDAQIMIATEAAAEGINLQFCSLVVNYDLPWNPQRIEQRIGRCHRYGQRHDVVVVNFLNERNAADLRVYEILEQKFNLFSGVFGASDEVLGSIESGVDFERRILDIYQQCRDPEEIEAAFAALRRELDERIQSRLAEARQQLLEYFDEDVHARLRVNLQGARQQLDRVGQMFWRLTKFILADMAGFDDENLTFDLERRPCPDVERDRCTLETRHLAFMDFDCIYFELQEYKNERSWHNLSLPREAVPALLGRDDWYDLLIPEEEMQATSFKQVARWQEIAVALLKKYIDRYYKFRKQEYESQYLEYRELSEDDPDFITEYRLLVERSRDDIIKKLEEIKGLLQAGQLRTVEFQKLQVIAFDRHPYQPLIYAGSDAVEVKPVVLENEGERDFVLDLQEFCEQHRDFLQGKELYLLRNMSRGRGVGFFEAGNFYPDFIVWLLADGHQHVSFVDPKGLRNLEGAADPKIAFHQTIKDLEQRLKDSEVSLNSFIVSKTRSPDIKWWGGGMSKEDLEARNVLFQTEDRGTYIRRLLERTLMS